MPDYNTNAGAGQGPIRRSVRAPPTRRYGPGGLPTEGAEPAPKPWPIVPWIALIFCIGFLGLQLYPATHFRHPKDPSRTWVPIIRDDDGNIDHASSIEEGKRMWGLRDEFEEVLPLSRIEEEELGEDVRRGHEQLVRQSTQDVQIFLSTDEKDLRPLLVVINSTLSNARHPERLKFHLVIPASQSNLEYWKLKASLPEADIEIFSEGLDMEKISKLITYRKDSKAGKELTTPYNYLLYYLPEAIKDKNYNKIIYLDTDVVVKGNVEELYRKGLEGRPVAAVKDCSQNFKQYFDFKQLKQIQSRENGSNPWLPAVPFDDQECVYNRGALLIDVKQWIQQNITEAIEWWINEFNNANKPLYKYGASQPPFMLALYKNYKQLESEWNVRGLGRNQFSDHEMDFYQETGERPQRQPFVALESDYAKILHFNGQYKPWKRGRTRSPDEEVISLCGEAGKECYKLWWEYLSPTADAAFK